MKTRGVEKDLRKENQQLQIKLKEAEERIRELQNAFKAPITVINPDHKILEELLSESQANLSALFHATDESVYLISADGTILDLNNGAAKMIGQPKEELIGKTVNQILPAEVVSHRYPSIAEAMSSGKQISFEDNRNGKKMLSRIYPIADSNGEMVRMAIYSRDITAEQEANNTLVASEAKFRRLFESASLGIFQSTPSGMVITVNPAFATMFGYESPGEVERSIKNIATDLFADPNRREEVLQLMAMDPDLKTFQNHYRRKDGSTFIGQLYISRIKDENGHLDHLEGFISDISAQKEADESRKKSEEKFRNFFENSIVGKSITSLNGELHTNKAYCDILGYAQDELSTRRWQEITHPDDIEGNLKIIENILSGAQDSTRWEKRYLHKDGHVVWVDINITIQRDEAGQPPYFITSIVDISDKKKAEEEIRLKNEELQKINAEKDKFFSIITHDLRSPFNSIMGFTQLLIDTIKEKEYDSTLEYAEIILRSSEKTVNLLNNLMEWSQSQTGRMHCVPEYFEMGILIHQTVLLFDEIAKQKSLVVKKNFPTRTTVFADKAMIGTVLRNLVSNAIKFTRPEGLITISVEPQMDGLLISVKDNGVGIPKILQDKLFRIDENFSTKGTNNELGTGLGLILCKEFVDKNGGKIWVQSEEGNGSEIYFTVPAQAH